jgi:uncharacterized protein YndB with AHSA1/START domain
MSTQPIIVEKVINAPVDRVWKAITDKSQMKEWYFNIPTFEPKEGFEFQFEGGPDDRRYLHVCKVTEVITNKKLQHTWRYQGHAGDSVVTWELTDMGGKTRVRLTHTGVETFPKIQDFNKSNFEAGWSDIVGTQLPKFVEG